MGKKTGFTEDWLKTKGLVEVEKNVFQKDVVKLGGGQEVTIKDLVAKEKVNNSPDFVVQPVTEWFIAGYNVPSKKNSRQNFVRNGKQISIPSKNHAIYVKMTAMQYAVFGKEFRSAVTFYELKYPLRIEFTFIRNSRRRFDYANAGQSVEDLLVSNKWIEDDSADHLIPVFQQYRYDKQNPGVRIKLLVK